jgi:hypothetical protein
MSRSATPDPFGKVSSEVKVGLPEEVRDHLAGLAALDGQTVSEYMRRVIEIHLYGELAMTRLWARRGRNGTPE